MISQQLKNVKRANRQESVKQRQPIDSRSWLANRKKQSYSNSIGKGISHAETQLYARRSPA